MTLREITGILEAAIPVGYQEDYDNSGLSVGDPESTITGILLCIDVTPGVVDEAVKEGCNLILSHHPAIFNPVKKLTGKTVTETVIINAIRNNIALYAAHTNADNLINGVNSTLCSKLGLENTRILVPQQNSLCKLITYVPVAHADVVRSALFEAGAGHIGRYDSCSFQSTGKGSFRALEGAKPFTGKVGQLHFEDELRIETVFPRARQSAVIRALIAAHPYEEVAYDIISLENVNEMAGSGMTGELTEPTDEETFLQKVKSVLGCRVIRHSRLLQKPVRKVALCGGSGSFLIDAAIRSGATMFLTADIKYHQFFEAEDHLVIADIGHYESEQFTIEIFYDILRKNLPNFAIRFSHINTNPINYL
ncbi:MAG: Nif3-like dinuclear metal center hexameric protein [Bacteroidales bacterium]|nr:Nif3-like dinuclear metal center hexameric protein [Bacteroidales bacterium]